MLALPHPCKRFDAMMPEATLDLSATRLADIRAQERSGEAVIECAFPAAAERGEIRTADPVLVAHAFLALLRVGQVRK